MEYFLGFEKAEFEFKEKKAIIVFADKKNRTNKWLLKTEYFGAFPELEVTMLQKGYNIAHVENETRWCLDSDTERQGEFCKFLSNKYGFEEKCVPVGMSCGGMQAIFFAAKYPEYKDLSQKVKAARYTMMKTGKYNAPFPIYGYIKYNDSLIIDDVAGKIVARIFDMIDSGMLPTAVAAELNKEGVLTPASYKKSQNCKRRWNYDEKKPYWTDSTNEESFDENFINYFISKVKIYNNKQVEITWNFGLNEFLNENGGQMYA